MLLVTILGIAGFAAVSLESLGVAVAFFGAAALLLVYS